MDNGEWKIRLLSRTTEAEKCGYLNRKIDKGRVFFYKCYYINNLQKGRDLMTAECARTKLRFQGLDGRDVVGRFDGGEITSDAGGVLLREVEQRTRILGRLSECFTDHRDPDRIEHSVVALTKQRVLGLCLGYEDLNDHDELCRDRLLALLCDRDDLTGEFRRVESDRGKPLAGKSTLNRLERTPLEGPEGAYKKIVADPAGMDALLLEVFVEAHPEPPEEVILDVDATDDPLHGKQEGRFFHGYYKRNILPVMLLTT